MCFLLTIIVIVIIIYMVRKNKKTGSKEQCQSTISTPQCQSTISTPQDQKSSDYIVELQKLPDKVFLAQELSSLAKAGNLWPTDEKLLQTFSYSNGNLVIRMKNGMSFNAPIINTTCSFTVFDGENYQADLSYGNQKLTIFTYAYLFPDEQWYEIFAYLSYCGTTYGSESITESSRFERQAALRKKQTMDLIKGGVKFLKIISKM